MSLRRQLLPGLAIALLSRGSLAQQLPPATFVTTLGRDTIAIERYRSKDSRITGDIVLRVPTTVHFQYTVDMRPDGTPLRSRVELKALRNDHARRVVVIDYRGDSARVVVDSAGVRDTVTRATATTTIPSLITGFGSSFGIYTSIGMLQLGLQRLALSPRDSVAVPTMGGLSGRITPRVFVRRSSSLTDVDYFRMAWIHLTTDAQGLIERVDASETTERTIATRSDPLDVAAAAKDFASRDAAGRGVGIASPPDSARALLGSTAVSVMYSSPRVRSRRILGATVPLDQVWRTGANAATVLRTERALLVGEASLPAGSYSMWTLPTTDGVTLIINRQHGQWGTEYDASNDIVRIPMRSSRATEPRENFAIELTASGRTGELRIAWSDFIWSVSLRDP